MSLVSLILSIHFIFSVIRVTTPLLFASLSSLISEESGVSNIAIEGIMLSSALFAVLGSAYFGASSLAGVIVSVLIGTLLGLALGYVIIELEVNEVIAGIAFNLTASGLTVFVMYLVTGDKGLTSSLISGSLPNIKLPFIENLPIIGSLISGHNILTYLSILTVFLLTVLLYRTRLGLHIRSSGESPKTLESAGVSVKKVRYIALSLSGGLAALGGAYLSMGNVNYFVRDMVSGRGFIAIAAASLGRNKPVLTMFVCLLFGFTEALSINPMIQNMGIPTEIIATIPYVITIVALILNSYKVKEN